MSTTEQNLERSLSALREQVERGFLERHGRAATVVVAAPGRVNLIGEHVDFNDGFVLPMALERYVVIAADRCPENSLPGSASIHSTCLGETKTIQLDNQIEPGRKGWISYVEGVFAGFQELGETIPTFDAVVGSTVPVGGGLSSSAALEVATATLLEEITGRKLSQVDKALLCQRAENNFAGVPCGMMDQVSSVFGKSDNLLLIDCRSHVVEYVPFNTSEVSVLVTNSNVKHDLTGGEYATRRFECDTALKKLNKASWREVTLEEVVAAKEVFTPTETSRARHVVSETQRTLDAATAIRSCDWQAVGKLMYASHQSLRTDFEVSCVELDLLVDIASKIGESAGMIGSRMTGGGFGGCTVSLVENHKMDSVIDTLTSRYESESGIQATCFCCRPGDGAHLISS